MVADLCDCLEDSMVKFENKWSESTTVQSVVISHPRRIAWDIIEYGLVPHGITIRMSFLHPFDQFWVEICSQIEWEQKHARYAARPPATFGVLRYGMQNRECFLNIREGDCLAWDREDTGHYIGSTHPAFEIL
jgi:hypothetical protein